MSLETAAHEAPMAGCWRHIGISGDGSCPELLKVVHCHHCPVYLDAGRGLLDRDTWSAYRAEWTALLSRDVAPRSSETESVVLFQLGEEHLALPTSVFREVVERRFVHSLPARQGRILQGLVNVRGEIQLCVSLATVLGLAEAAAQGAAAEGRMLVVEERKEAWVFPVSRVFGTLRYDPARLRPAPATLHMADNRFTRGTFEWEGMVVGCLDDAALFEAVRKGIA